MTWHHFLSRQSQSNSSSLRETRLQLEQLETRHLLSAEPFLIDIDLGGNSSPRQMTEVNGTVFYSAVDIEHGRELWMTDGTSEGTQFVKDIHPGTEDSTPIDLINANGILYFIANDGVHGAELWITDGTAEGTRLVKDLKTGSNSSSPSTLVSMGDNQAFFANADSIGASLWLTDGTEEGTILIQALNEQSNDSFTQSYRLANLNGTLFFFSEYCFLRQRVMEE
ncbi:Hypothetical protein PBC10988_32490 [Planctomycetales bacterium 10988]|nr:Hypothetical protein PBC10988_32490 [Planctomycetales bacterium 10988]